MKCAIILFCSLFLFSCSDSFINHELKYEKLGECGNLQKGAKMNSNINGERYEFICCLDDGFDGKNYTVERKGDSILVNFPRSATKKTMAYHLTLDIDAKPAYRYIVLDGQGIDITTTDVPKN
jgi:hypothetical protein